MLGLHSQKVLSKTLANICSPSDGEKTTLWQKIDCSSKILWDKAFQSYFSFLQSTFDLPQRLHF